MSAFADAARDPEGAAIRDRLRRVREALDEGRAPDPEDAAFLAAALREIDEGWPVAPKKRAETFGRVFARAFGLASKAGRKGKGRRSAREEKPLRALARAVIERMEAGETYEAACEAVAEATRTSVRSVQRAYSDKREWIEMERAVVKQTVERARALNEVLRKFAQGVKNQR